MFNEYNTYEGTFRGVDNFHYTKEVNARTSNEAASKIENENRNFKEWVNPPKIKQS